MKSLSFLHGAIIAAFVMSIGSIAASQVIRLPDWAIGPFSRPVNANPLIKPDPDAEFFCPMRQMPVRWEALHTFNPAAAVHDGKVFLLYRAEDASGTMKIGMHTSRLGLGISEDGLNFAGIVSRGR